jgi:hypothetical protein
MKVCGQLPVPFALFQGRHHHLRYPFDNSQSRFWTLWSRENSFAPIGHQTPILRPSLPSPLATLTELPVLMFGNYEYISELFNAESTVC